MSGLVRYARRHSSIRRSALGIAVLAVGATYLTPFRSSPTRLYTSFLFTPMSGPSIKAPQPPPKWKHAPEEIKPLIIAAIDRAKKDHDEVAAIPASEANFQNVFFALSRTESTLESIAEPLTFYQNASPNKDLRDASNEAEVLLRDFAVEDEMRVDVYESLLNAEKNLDQSKLSPEEKRLVEKMLLDGKRSGLGLPKEKRDKLTELKKELSQKCLEFMKNFNEEKAVISFTIEELKGIPQDVISGYGRKEEYYEVTYKTPDIFPVLKYAENPETRRFAQEGYEGRLAINAPLLDRVLELRRECAAVLGYATWADFVLEPKMIKTTKAVFDFLDDLEQKLKPVGAKDRMTLLALKKAEHERLGLPFDGEFYLWDYRYYDRIFVEKTLDLDDSLVKEYFPVDAVVPAILDIYQGLLGVRFEEIKNPDVWHPDVRQFAVWNQNATDESGFLGYTHLDLFPREGKYGHAAVWPVIAGSQKPDGSRHYPVTVMLANLAKSTPDRKALMRHDDVVTFFHEMGHVFHGLLSQTKFSRFHGTSVARDFVEAPSQMLENWCWEPEVLKKMSSHFEKKEPLSDDLIHKIIKSRYVNIGLFFLRQIFFAKFDAIVHTQPADKLGDLSTLWNDLRTNISLVKSLEPQPSQGSFGHITGGYDAGYYSYSYSLVFAADMYATIFKKAPLDPVSGKRYRDEILLPGASRDEMDSLKAFLGRPPNSDAFLNNLFGNDAQASSL